MRRMLLVFALAPLLVATTPGDIGGCSDEVKDLDQTAFGKERKRVDCQHCQACALSTKRCAIACNEGIQPNTLPSTCRPLERDGEVCLHALQVASCGDYAGYMDDTAPLTSSECEFCRGVTP